MFTKQILNLAKVFEKKDIIKKEDKDIIFYGLKVMLQQFINFSSALICGLVFNLILECFVFLITLSFLRTYAGGFHCKKAVNCYLLSCGIVALALAVIKFTALDFMALFSIGLIIFSVTIILKLAPVEAKNKPLDEDEKIRYRKITLRNLLIECVAVIVLLALNQLSFAFAISISIGITSILLLIEENE